jgi:hypothetical protein
VIRGISGVTKNRETKLIKARRTSTEVSGHLGNELRVVPTSLFQSSVFTAQRGTAVKQQAETLLNGPPRPEQLSGGGGDFGNHRISTNVHNK